MLAKHPTSTKIYRVECIACAGHGVIDLGEDRPTCRACGGLGEFEVNGDDDPGFDDGPLWDAAVTHVWAMGGEVHHNVAGLRLVRDRYECFR